MTPYQDSMTDIWSVTNSEILSYRGVNYNIGYFADSVRTTIQPVIELSKSTLQN